MDFSSRKSFQLERGGELGGLNFGEAVAVGVPVESLR
jgi:hypothetical protein